MEGSDNDFRIVAENKAGIGEASDSTGRFVAKDAFTTPGKPDAPLVSEITKESATIVWEAPTKDGDSPILDYMLEMKTSGDLKWKMVNKSIKERTFTMKDLKEDGEYEFRVTAQNKAGAGQSSHASNTAKYGQLAIHLLLCGYLNAISIFLNYKL